ncbi:MAG: hypothetical protein EBQ96_03625 [Proteobacteria bacterium]|nr:hypothetical protein [Pseudomonadota bacterium]
MSYISELNTPSRKRHALFVDDRMLVTVDPEHMFKNCGVDVEVHCVRSSEEAKEILDDWARQGIRADVMSCDDNELGWGEIGCMIYDEMLPYLRDTYGPEFVPEKFFIHSAGTCHTREINGFGEPDWFRGEELGEISSWGKASEDGYMMRHGRMFDNTTLRQYCNEAWGAKFVLTESAMRFITNPDRRLDAQEAHSLVTYEKEATPDEALRRLKIDSDSFVTKTFLNGAHNLPTIEFADAVGGAVVGVLAFNADDVARLRRENPQEPIVLCMQEYHPSLISLVQSVDGVVLFGTGSEHLKVVLENGDIPAVLGLKGRDEGVRNNIEVKETDGALHVVKYTYDHDRKQFDGTDLILKAGDYISLDHTTWTSSTSRFDGEDDVVVTGITGNLYLGKSGTWTPEGRDLEWMQDLARWADDARAKTIPFAIKANADTADAITKAKASGATGIGLVRTEHMLMADASRDLLQTVFLTTDEDTRASALSLLGEQHKGELVALFEAADLRDPDFNMTIRLCDAPLDEFLDTAQVEAVKDRVGRDKFGRDNFRGYQMAKGTPGFYAMQIEAIFEAAQSAGWSKPVEIMVPNIWGADDMKDVRALCEKIAKGRPYRLGAMIETSGALHNADFVAKVSDFISFGTNDIMTHLMNGVQRNDVDGIAAWMIKNGVRGESPYKVVTKPLLDCLSAAVTLIRTVRPDIDISACGQQWGSDATGTNFAIGLGLNGVSVSPKYVMQARIHSGHFALHAHDARTGHTPDAPVAAQARGDIVLGYRGRGGNRPEMP